MIEAYAAEGKPFNLGMVFPVSTHNYELRYWLAAGGINPGVYSADDVSGQIGGDVLISVTPPPQMPATLEAGTIDGYAVGEPWNQAAVAKGIGVPVITDNDIWKNNPEKVFGLTAEFVEANPQTTLALTKALIRAAIWLDENDNANRAEAVEILARSEYVGADDTRKVQVMLHRAILGSLERFIGILIENFSGALPLWLAPVQVVVLNISEKQADYAADVAQKLHQAGFRAESDLRNEKITYKIREHSLNRLPYQLVVGDKEKADGLVAVRTRGGQDLGQMSVDDLIKRLQQEVAEQGASPQRRNYGPGDSSPGCRR